MPIDKAGKSNEGGGGGWWVENKRICQQLLLCVLHIDWHCTTANSRLAGWMVAGLGSLVPKACYIVPGEFGAGAEHLAAPHW